MARIRTVKPEFYTHPEILRLSIPARLLFLSLLNQADDEGRLYDQPLKIAGQAFGEADRANVRKLLSELSSNSRILRYDAEGRSCIQVLNFLEHQSISKPRASEIPPPCVPEDSGSPPGNVPEPSRKAPRGNGMEWNGTGNGMETREIARAFERFWKTYPRKVGKPKAKAAYDRAAQRARLAEILTGAERYRDDPNREPQFTAHPTTWLNRDGWGDDPLPSKGKPDPHSPWDSTGDAA